MNTIVDVVFCVLLAAPVVWLIWRMLSERRRERDLGPAIECPGDVFKAFSGNRTEDGQFVWADEDTVTPEQRAFREQLVNQLDREPW